MAPRAMEHTASNVRAEAFRRHAHAAAVGPPQSGRGHPFPACAPASSGLRCRASRLGASSKRSSQTGADTQTAGRAGRPCAFWEAEVKRRPRISADPDASLMRGKFRPLRNPPVSPQSPDDGDRTADTGRGRRRTTTAGPRGARPSPKE